MLAGLPTTSTFTLRLATASSAFPCSVNIFAFSSKRSLRSIPGCAAGTDEHGNVDVLKATLGSAVPVIPVSKGNAQSSSSIMTPFRAACALSIGSSSNCSCTGWSRPSISPLAIRKSRL